MELKNGILHVRVSLKPKGRNRNISVVDNPSDFTPSSTKSHRTTLSLSIPSESSPRLANLKKKNFKKPLGPMNKKCSKPSLINFSLKPKVLNKQRVPVPENKENQKFFLKESSVKPEEIPSTLLKSSRKSILSSILQTSHKHLTLSSNLKLSLN